MIQGSTLDRAKRMLSLFGETLPAQGNYFRQGSKTDSTIRELALMIRSTYTFASRLRDVRIILTNGGYSPTTLQIANLFRSVFEGEINPSTIRDHLAEMSRTDPTPVSDTTIQSTIETLKTEGFYYKSYVRLMNELAIFIRDRIIHTETLDPSLHEKLEPLLDVLDREVLDPEIRSATDFWMAMLRSFCKEGDLSIIDSLPELLYLKGVSILTHVMIAQLARSCTQLRYLSVTPSLQMDLDQRLESLKALTTLTSLEVRGLLPESAYNKLELLTHLRSLALVSNLTLGHLNLPELPNITFLQLRNSSLTSLGGLTLTSLTALDLSSSGITDEGLAGVWDLTTLRELHLHSCQRVRTTGDVTRLTNLAVLTLSGHSKVDELAAPSFTTLTNLTDLGMHGCSRIASYILPYLHTGLQTLNMPQNGQIAPDKFTSLRRLTDLRSLDISGDQHANNALTDDTVRSLGGLTKLESLNMARSFSVTSGPLGETLSGLTSLTDLSLSGCTKLDQAVLQALTHLSSLTSLKLDHNPWLYTVPIDQLRDLLKRLTRLKRLDLTGTRVHIPDLYSVLDTPDLEIAHSQR